MKSPSQLFVTLYLIGLALLSRSHLSLSQSDNQQDDHLINYLNSILTTPHSHTNNSSTPLSEITLPNNNVNLTHFAIYIAAANIYNKIFPNEYQHPTYHQTITLEILKTSKQFDQCTIEDNLTGEISFTFSKDQQLTVMKIVKPGFDTKDETMSDETKFAWYNKNSIVLSICNSLTRLRKEVTQKHVIDSMAYPDTLRLKKIVFDRERNTRALLDQAAAPYALTQLQKNMLTHSQSYSTEIKSSQMMIHWYAKTVELLRHLLGPYRKNITMNNYFWPHIYNTSSHEKADLHYIASLASGQALLTPQSFQHAMDGVLSPHNEKKLTDILNHPVLNFISKMYPITQIAHVKFKVQFISLIKDFIYNISKEPVVALEMLLAIKHQIKHVCKKSQYVSSANQIKLEKTVDSLIQQIKTLGAMIRTDHTEFYTDDDSLRLAYLLIQHPEFAVANNEQQSAENTLTQSSDTSDYNVYSLEKIFSELPAGLSRPTDTVWSDYYLIFGLHLPTSKHDKLKQIVNSRVKLPSGAAFDNKFTHQPDPNGQNWHQHLSKIMLKHDNLLHQTKHFLNILSHHNEPYLVMRTVFWIKSALIINKLFWYSLLLYNIGRTLNISITYCEAVPEVKAIDQETLSKWHKMSNAIQQKVTSKRLVWLKDFSKLYKQAQKREAEQQAFLKHQMDEQKRKQTEKKRASAILEKTIDKTYSTIQTFCRDYSVWAHHQSDHNNRVPELKKKIDINWFLNKEIKLHLPAITSQQQPSNRRSRQNTGSLFTEVRPRSLDDLQRISDGILNKVFTLDRVISNDKSAQFLKRFEKINSSINSTVKDSKSIKSRSMMAS